MAGETPNSSKSEGKFGTGNSNKHSSDNNTPSDLNNSSKVDFARVLQLLACGVIREEHGMLRWSSNYTFLVSVSDDELQAMAVYKPQRGERPLWDFPDGTLCYRETAAYVVSEALGWQIVPPTVLRDGPRGLGSLQLYIQNSPDVNYFSLDERAAPQLMRFAAFDYIVNNADRKGGHCLLGSGRSSMGHRPRHCVSYCTQTAHCDLGFRRSEDTRAAALPTYSGCVGTWKTLKARSDWNWTSCLPTPK